MSSANRQFRDFSTGSDVESGFSQSSIYHELQDLMSMEQLIRDREELGRHKETLYEIDTTNNVKDLILHGLSDDEISDINNINTNVKKGKDLLLKTLGDLDICIDEIKQTETTIHITETAIRHIRQSLENLTRIHKELVNITTDFLQSLLEKQESIINDLNTSQGILICKKDKLEAIIHSLSCTYNIIKNTPFTHTCPICITREVDTYLDPCGHTLCRHCNKDTHCHMCRTRIRSTKSLYYS
jgi:hypothetical protein